VRRDLAGINFSLAAAGYRLDTKGTRQSQAEKLAAVRSVPPPAAAPVRFSAKIGMCAVCD
jgi:hypothetical protein